MDEAAQDFWRFSLAVYGSAGVARACLELQDSFGRDVTLLLFVCWLGATGRGRLSAAELETLQAIAAPWREAVLRPLRAARRAIKGAAGADGLYEQAKALELEAERVAGRRLAATAVPVDPSVPVAARVADAEANLALYIGAAAVSRDLAARIADAAAEVLRGPAAMGIEAGPPGDAGGHPAGNLGG